MLLEESRRAELALSSVGGHARQAGALREGRGPRVRTECGWQLVQGQWHRAGRQTGWERAPGRSKEHARLRWTQRVDSGDHFPSRKFPRRKEV